MLNEGNRLEEVPFNIWLLTMKTYLKLILPVLALALATCDKVEKPEPGNTTKIIVISDLHLGDSRSIRDGYGWSLGMRDTLGMFLDYLAADDSWDELVIAGDMIDEWVVPAGYETLADKDGNPVSEREFFGEVISANSDIFDKFWTLKNQGRKLVYIPGNHDMSTTADDFNQLLPGLFHQARSATVAGVGEYRPCGEVFIEHGHRYDVMNAPYVGKVGIDDIPDGSILPPGFFVSNVVASADLRKLSPTSQTRLQVTALDDVAYDLYWKVIESSYGQDSVITNIDGMKRKYAYEEYAKSSAYLFKNVDKYDEPNDGWNVRCSRNEAVLVPSISNCIIGQMFYSFYDQIGLDVLASSSFSPRVLVWGHTHEPKLEKGDSAEGRRTIYVNTGCWVDASRAGAENTSTFCVIEYGGLTVSASIKRFDVDVLGQPTITLLDKESILDL